MMVFIAVCLVLFRVGVLRADYVVDCTRFKAHLYKYISNHRAHMLLSDVCVCVTATTHSLICSIHIRCTTDRAAQISASATRDT